MSKPQNFCMFCNGGDLSKEHIWPSWIGPIIHKIHPSSRHGVSTTIYDGEPIVQKGKGKLNRPGNPSSQRLRVVCKKCNNGWMSRLQIKAKPTLARLIQGDWSTTSIDGLRDIAVWATMTSMVIEQADKTTMVITQAERSEFKQNQTPPEYWKIYIAPFEGSDGDFWHTSFGDFSRQEYMQPDFQVNGLYHSHVKTFAIGHILFHVVGSKNPGFVLPENYARHLELLEIFPRIEIGPQRQLVHNSESAVLVQTYLRKMMTDIKGVKSFIPVIDF